jgi:hypothetical protein
MTRRTLLLVASIISAMTWLLAIPATSQAAVSVNLGISLGAPPPLVVVPGLPVYYAPTLPYNYFVYGHRYYTCMNDHWYYAPTYNGPWTVIAVSRVPSPILRVPVQYYKVPPGHGSRHGPPPWAGQGKAHGHGHDQKEKHHGHGHDKD